MQEPIVQRIAVSFEYPVWFTYDVTARDNPVLTRVLARPDGPQRAALVIEEALAGLAGPLEARLRRDPAVELAAPALLCPGGEAEKSNPAGVERLLGRFEALRLDRQACVVAAGGGALLDLVGYAAALVHRGLRLVRLPTTLLAQADSGVGVKNGVNAYGKKNFLGTFAPPHAVVNDARFLETLPRREAVAGMAEAVKVALLRDPAFFAWIGRAAPRLAALELAALRRLVRRSAELHLEHIARSGDAFERRSARPLDFGHWSAHKLESLTSGRLRHGEAVAIGVAIDTLYAAEIGLPAPAAEVLGTLGALGLPRWDPALELRRPDGRRAVLDGIEEFREHLGGRLTLTLLRAIGEPVDVHEVDEAALERAIRRVGRGAP